MFKFAEFVEPFPDPFWTLLKQLGVDHVVSTLYDAEVGVRNWLSNDTYLTQGMTAPLVKDDEGHYSWEYKPLQRLKQAYENAGLSVAVIEDTPPMDKVRLGLPGRDDEIEAFSTLVRNMGKLDIPVLSYDFMTVFDWMRTSTDSAGRGGALVSRYDHAVMNSAPLTFAGVVPEERMWQNLQYFLAAVVPIAERSNVRLALHPDDPPISPVRGLGRIMCSVEALQRAIDLVPSSHNGLTFCQGNITLMTDDLPSAIRRFGDQERIFFVHFRDVRGTPESFTETFHDEGQTNMLNCMRAYRDIGFDGVMRSDHVPTLEGDTNVKPGYSTLGRLFAIGYMTGLRESAFDSGDMDRTGPLSDRSSAARS